jgi:hypothetical protein
MRLAEEILNYIEYLKELELDAYNVEIAELLELASIVNDKPLVLRYWRIKHAIEAINQKFNLNIKIITREDNLLL